MRINFATRRGLTGTAAAVAAMAALTASQAPGFTGYPLNAERAAAQDDVVWTEVPNDDSYHTELPPLKTPEPPKGGAKPGPVDILATRAEAGIPATVLAAYRRAEAALGRSDAGCNLPWQLLAAIGKVESGQARGGRVDSSGTTLGSILGPVLNGVGFANISDTDDGAYDGDAQYDRAVGPMQFIPSTWATWGKDGNGDGRRDPNNIYDASLAAGHYLCAGTRNLKTRADLDRAILSYNHSDTYLRTVLSWLEFYRQGAHPVADGEGPIPRSPGPGGPTEPRTPVGGPGTGSTGSGSPAGPGEGGGGIVIGPQPTTPPPRPKPSGPSRPSSPGPDPTETGPTDPGPDPTDTGSPSPSPSPTDPTTPPVTPSPTTPPPSPSPDPSTTPACPTDSPSPDPSPDPTDTTAPATGTQTEAPDPCADAAASAA